MIEHVEEVDTNFKLVAFPRRERHPDSFRQAEIEPVPRRSTQCIASHDSSTDVGIDYKECIVERDWSDEVVLAIARWRLDVAETVGNRHRVSRSIWIANRGPIVRGYAVAVDVKTIQVSRFHSS